MIQRLAVLFLTLSVQTAVWSQESKVKLISKVTSNSIYQNECCTLSSRLLVRNDNELDLRFTRLGPQINTIRSILTELDLIYREWAITDISKKREYYNGHAYDAYEIIRIGLCPYKSGELVTPSLSLNLNKMDTANNVEGTLTFSSNPVHVQVKPIPDSLVDPVYSNEFYKMVGEFSASERIKGSNRIQTGDTVEYSVTLAGNGIGEMIDCDLQSPLGVKVISTEKTIKNNPIDVGFSTEFKFGLVFQGSGDFDLKNLFQWRYYSPIEDAIKIISPETKLSVYSSFGDQGLSIIQSKVEKKGNLTNLIIALDVSESMNIGDYSPSRLRVIVNALEDFFHKYDYKIPIVLYSKETKVIDSNQVSEIIDITDFKYEQGTDIANAIWESVKFLKKSDATKRSILLIGDGDNSAGYMNINTALNIVNKNQIKLNSIGVGRLGKVPFGKDSLGRVRYVKDTYYPDILKAISKTTKGRFYQYGDKRAFITWLEEIFKAHAAYDR